MIPAKPLHDAIVALLAEVLLDAPDLRARLVKHLQDQREEASRDQPDERQLEAERDEVKQKFVATVRSLTGAALEDAQEELKRLGDHRNAIEARLAAIRSQQTQEMRPVEEVIDEALHVLAVESQRLLRLPLEAVRESVNHLIADATVDMETKAVELKVTLPTWALEAKPKLKKRKNRQEAVAEGTEAVCPAPSLRSQLDSWTQQPLLLLGKAKCVYVKQREPCYQCRRSAA